MGESEFWRSVRRRRLFVILWWLGWIPFGSIAIQLSSRIYSGQAPEHYMPVVLAGYSLFWFYLQIRVTTLRCPRCSQAAVASPFPTWSRLKCRHCGLEEQK